MGTITAGIGLISGIDTAALIETYLVVESQGKVRLQQRIGSLQAQQTALMDINARLLNFKTASRAFRINQIFQSALATSSNADVLTATASTSAQPGSFKFIVKQLVSTSQQITRGYATADADPLGLDALSFEFGNGGLSRDAALEDLNGGSGVDRGRIIITDRDGDSATIDLTDVTTLDEVLELTHVTGPGSAHEPPDRRIRHLGLRPLEVEGCEAPEVMGEEGHVGGPLLQRREPEGDQVEPVE